MKVIGNVSSLREYLENMPGRLVGFVPTMGALHSGHLSLVNRSAESCDISVVSIFVNPTQFNNAEDLKAYPRNSEKDLQMLREVLSEEDVVFIPEYDDLYHNEQEFTIDLGELDKVMEGHHRPGHFSGVVRVVKLLFEAVRPDKAFFGEKDFQQLTIVREMVRQLKMDIEIVACPILREPNGLAMSSRNERLSPEMRQKAAIIRSTLKKYGTDADWNTIGEIEKRVTEEIDSEEGFKTEYFEIVDSLTLTRISETDNYNPGSSYYGCIAVFAGNIRLIDNIRFSFLFIKG